jgi:hypothetical protein
VAKIDSYHNAVHSLGMGLFAFRQFHSDPTNPYMLKDAILRTHHGLETIFKDILYKTNPVLLLRKDAKFALFIDDYRIEKDLLSLLLTVKPGEGIVQHLGKLTEASSLIDEQQTIGLQDAIDRLHNVFSGLLLDKEYGLIKQAASDLTHHRNHLQHFAIEADDEALGRILGNLVPRSVQVLKLFYPQIEDDLNLVYDGSTETIELLGAQYDELVQAAVDFFAKKKFDGVNLKIKVRDHGKGFRSPPEMTLEGFIDMTLDHSTLFPTPQIDADYRRIPRIRFDGDLSVGHPVILNQVNTLEKVVQGSFKLVSTIQMSHAGENIRLLGADQHVPFLRSIEIRVAAELDYKARALYDQWHYDIREVIDAIGSLRLWITAKSMGSQESVSKPEVLGTFEAQLTKENARMRYHAFVQPDMTLSDNHMLEWNISAGGDLVFV